MGAELVEFSPITDRTLPPGLDGIYLGGGYPELHAEALAANDSMRAAVAEFVAGNAPVYAECGGFLYLTRAIVDAQKRSWPMAGVFPTSAHMQTRLARLGYVEVETNGAESWLAPGERARGHEFRYSVIDPMPEGICRVYREPAEGYRVKSVLGSYIHLHFRSCPSFAERFVEECAQRRAGRFHD
jgi:cobyrinic acid a,c-diamide synthase